METRYARLDNAPPTIPNPSNEHATFGLVKIDRRFVKANYSIYKQYMFSIYACGNGILDQIG